MEMYYIMNYPNSFSLKCDPSNKVCFLMLCSWCQCMQLYSVFRPEVTGLLKTKSSHTVSGVSPLPRVKRIGLMYITFYCTSAFLPLSLSSLLKSRNGNAITHTELSCSARIMAWSIPFQDVCQQDYLEKCWKYNTIP